jgi:DNA-binding MarR family transcriptional regulator
MPTTHGPAPSIFDPAGQHTDPAAKVTAAIDRLGLVLRSLLQEEARAGDPALSPLQVQALVFLRYHPALARVGQLAREFEVSAPTVSDAVRVLVKKGLVEKARDPDDGRATVLRLTTAGVTAAERLATWAGAVREHVAEADPAVRDAALAFLLGLIGRLAQAGVVSAARTCPTCQYLGPPRESGAAYHCLLADVPLAARDLRLDCPDHEPAPPA